MRQSVFFGAVGQKAETADTLEAVGEHVKQEAADELFGIEGHRFQPVFISLTAKSGLDNHLAGFSERRYGWLRANPTT